MRYVYKRTARRGASTRRRNTSEIGHPKSTTIVGSDESPKSRFRDLMPLRIAVLGAGNMGAALIGGILNRGTPASQVIATTRTAERAEALAAKYGITAM